MVGRHTAWYLERSPFEFCLVEQQRVRCGLWILELNIRVPANTGQDAHEEERHERLGKQTLPLWVPSKLVAQYCDPVHSAT